MEREPETAMRENTLELSTPRLAIRRFTQDEWPLLLAYLQDDGIADAFPEGIYTEQRLREMTEDRDLYALVSIEDERLIGHAALRVGVHPSGAALALGVISTSRRQGYGEEAARALLRQAFAKLGLHRVTVSCPPENLALRALLEKLGMRMEAFFRRSVLTLDGEWRDECVYALLAEEWRIQESLRELEQDRANERETGEEKGSAEIDEDRPDFGREALDELAALAVVGTGLAEEPDSAELAPPVRLSEEVPEEAANDVFSAEVVSGPVSPAEHTAEPIAEPIEELMPPPTAIETAEIVEAMEAVVEEEEVWVEDSPEPGIPQVTLALDEGRPFVPILPASLSPVPPVSSGPNLPEGLIEQRIDGVPFVLRRPHDFNWLAPFGRVFRVWDRQDSGNLAFGLEIEGQKVFIKYAGAFTAEYNGHPVEAIRRLREAAGVHEVLQHPALVKVLDHFETPDGYAVLYEWAEGRLLRPGAEEGGADAAISRFRRLPIEERIEAMDTILEFHAYAEAMNYVAIDFYDGSLIYDFETRRMTICDIDYYRPKPYINEMGRMWGSSRFMSPEEYEFGAPIDSRTNVYTMGAMAFFLLGGGEDRSRQLWEAGDELYQVALRAVSPERSQRWESIDALLEAWEAAK